MIIIKELLEIQKDINLLEEFGDYKSAKILHGKFVRLAQTSNMTSSVVDPNANTKQNEAFDDLLELLNNMKSQNRLERIRNIAESLSLNNQITPTQQKTLQGYAQELLNTDANSTTPDIDSVTPDPQFNTLTSTPTSKPKSTSTRQDDISKQFNPFSTEDNRPVRYHQYSDGSYTEIRTNTDYSEDRLYVGKDGFRQLYKNLPPETQLVNYQSSPGNWTTGVVPVGMDPKMADPTQREFARRKNWENSSGYNEFIANNPKATPSQIRDFIENGRVSSEGSTSSLSTNPSSNVPAKATRNTENYNSKPSVTDSSANAITTKSGSSLVTSSKKKFLRLSQDYTQMINSYDNYLKLIDNAIRNSDTTLLRQYYSQLESETNLNDMQKTQLQQRIITTLYGQRPANTDQTNQQQTNPNQQVNQQLQQQIDANQKNPQQAPTYSPDIENLIIEYSNTNAPSSFASLLNFVGVKLNIGFPQVVDILASKNVAIAGKPLATHKNKENLKQKLSSIQPSRSMNNNQLGQVVMYAMTDHNMPDGTPIKLSKYERLGLFRSTPEQEAVYLAQKIRHIQSGDAVPKSALLPRV